MHIEAVEKKIPDIIWLYAALTGAAAVLVAYSTNMAAACIALYIFLVLLSNPRLSLYGALLLFPLIHYKPLAGMKPSEMFILMLFASATLLIANRKLKPKVTKPVVYLLLFILVSVVSFIGSIGMPKDNVTVKSIVNAPYIISIMMILRFVVVALILLIVPFAIRNVQEFRKALGIHILAGSLAALFGFFLVALYIAGKPVDIPICRTFGGYSGMWGFRLAGTAFEPAGFANYLLAVAPVTFAAWINEQRRWISAGLFAALALQCGAMFFTLSSGGWIALAIALGAILVLLWRKISRNKKICLLALVMLPVLMMVQLSMAGILPANMSAFVLIGKFTTDTSGKTDRIETGRILIEMITDHPVMGIGIGNFAYRFGSYAHKSDKLTDEAFKLRYPATWRANNDYLSIAAETGIPGLAVFLIFLGSLLSFLVQTLKKARGKAEEAIIAGILFAVVAMLLQAFASFSILNPFAWVLSALVYGYYRVVLSTENENRI